MTRLEIINKAKEQYAELEQKIPTMTGIEKVVAENMTLVWIKGDKWMGGLSDRKAQRILERLEKQGWNMDELCEEFERQIGQY